MYFYLPNPKLMMAKDEECAHFIAMRVQVGQKVNITDLKGSLYQAVITQLNRKKPELRFQIIDSKHSVPHPPRLIMQAVLDKIYMEKFVEIIPLMNVTKVIFFTADRSLPSSINLPRLQKILLRSCEQGEKLWIPTLEVVTQDNILQYVENERPVVLEHKNNESGQLPRSNHNNVIVGPEGGWSDREVSFFESLNLEFQAMPESVFPGWLAGYTWLSKNPK